jgi:hypothetical protein
MVINITRKLFGVSFNMNFDLTFSYHRIYDFWLTKRFRNIENNDRENWMKFITVALKYLPHKSFILFGFDFEAVNFVQVSSWKNDHIIDLPMCKNNVYAGKHKKIIKLLDSLDIKSDKLVSRKKNYKGDYYYIQKINKTEESVKIYIKKDSAKTANIVFLIADKILDLPRVNPDGYYTGRLQEVRERVLRL